MRKVLKEFAFGVINEVFEHLLVVIFLVVLLLLYLIFRFGAPVLS